MHGKGIGNVIINISPILVTVTCACTKAAGRPRRAGDRDESSSGRQYLLASMYNMSCDEVFAMIASLPSRKELVVNSPRTVAVKECERGSSRLCEGAE